MSQQPLFQLELVTRNAELDDCGASKTGPATPSGVGDNRRVSRVSTVADRLQRTTDPIERARLAIELRDLADALVEETILQANGSGVTWRELGAGLGVPFQTLYRRYGGS